MIFIFSTINFSYQYLLEAKAYLQPGRTFTMELFREKKIIFFAKFTRKHLCRSLFLIKLQFSILQLDWKKGLQHRCFLMNFARYLRHLFDRTPPCDSFCSTEKYFTNKVAKNPLSKEKKMKTLVRKTTSYAKQKLTHYLRLHILLLFKNFVISLLFPWYTENTSF